MELRFKKYIEIKIFEITKEELEMLQHKKDNNIPFDCPEKQCFVLETQDYYVAVDNTSGDLYVEDFRLLDDAYVWLANLKEAEPLKEAEDKLSSWY